jgi:ketosteroid isomerase-like protein
MQKTLRVSVLLLAATIVTGAMRQQSPQAIANELLAADRAFSDAGSQLEIVDAIAAMFADDVMAPAKPGEFVKGKAELVAVMRANPLNAGTRASWAPVRAGISADGEHGFTFGFMTLRRGDTPPTRTKYLAYWVKKREGWRIVAYRRTPSAEGEISRDRMPPSLPASIVPVNADAALVARYRSSLVAAEKAFSDTSQTIGLGPAFRLNGRSDAVNLGGPSSADFTYGNEAIGEAVGKGSAGKPSPVNWSAGEGAIVASSGDLGVTFGIITPNGAPAGTPGFPFFTIWKRESVTAPWKYIAE